jgi:carnitine 3-dehydrogenase
MSEGNRLRKVALVGAGVIGGGWAARCLAAGLDVAVTDPYPEAESRFRSLLEVAIGSGAVNENRRLTYSRDLAEAVAGADFIQESATEDMATKSRLLAGIEAAARPDAIIGSSTSALLPSELQREMHHPERFLVGHPFNPVYLIPLVEIVPGRSTSGETVQLAESFYRRLGMSPLTLRTEVAGFLGNRLQEALWREALWIVNEGIATTARSRSDLDRGTRRRWALMGPFMTFHLAGGAGGIRYMLDHFGPSLKDPITKLDAPELTPDLIETVGRGCDAATGGRTIEDLMRRRDAFLRELDELLKRHALV